MDTVKYDLKLEKLAIDIAKHYIDFHKKMDKKDKIAVKRYQGTYYFAINQFLRKGTLIPTHFSKKQTTDDIIKSGLREYKGMIDTINSIDDLLNRCPTLKKRTTVYRGLHNCSFLRDSINILERVKLGTIVIFPNYISTSLDFRVANQFTTEFDKRAKLIFFGEKWPGSFERAKLNKKVLMTDFSGCDDIYDQFGDKIYYTMIIHLPKGCKPLYVEMPNNNGVLYNWEYEMLLPRMSNLRLIKRYDKLLKVQKRHKMDNIKKGKVNNRQTRIYEFEYVGTDADTNPVTVESRDLEFKHFINTGEKGYKKMLTELMKSK